MATVTVEVVAYPFAGVVGFQADEETLWGWVNVLDTATVGTFPNYTVSYALTVTDATNPIRVRWETATNRYTSWFNPNVVAVPISDSGVERITQAIIQKATRTLSLVGAPLGTWGELTDMGVAATRPDYEIQELLYGLRFRNWNLDLTALVTTDDVLRQGLQLDADGVTDFPADRLPDVQRAIDTAVSWVAHYLYYGTNFA